MISGNYNISADILRQNNVGTHTQPDFQWSILETVDGTLDQLSGNQIIRNEGKVIDADHKLYIDVTDIVETDRIEVDDISYAIYRIHDPNNLGRHLEVYMKKLGKGVTNISS